MTNPDDKQQDDVLPYRDDEEEFEEDEDESDNEQLETSGVQKLLSPIYLLLLLIFCGVATVPFLILYTVGWMAWDAGK
ncbi:hypothetical protein IT571_08590 [Candidatus Sumerlaeota bacterium]|nr:hypothetical protein [Candidatus Sumerlaeota bacterium]